MSANAADKAAVADTDDILFVEDPTARINDEPRKHEMLEDDPASGQRRIVPYIFKAGEKLQLPTHTAMRFAKAGMIVTDQNGQLYKPPSQVSDDAMRHLAPGECIARYDELKQEALLMRCKLIVGGEKFNKASRIADLIAFLTESDAKKAAELRARSAENDDGTEDISALSGDGTATVGGALSQAALAKIFGAVEG